MKYVIFIFFVYFFGCSLFTQNEQPTFNSDQKSSVQTSPTPKVSPVSDLLPTTAKVENISLSLDGCRINFDNGEKSSSFDFDFAGVCGFEANPDKISEPPIVKTPNGNVLAVIGVEKIENHNSTDKHDQPCNLKVRFVIVRESEIYLAAKTSEKPNSCITQFDEKDYFICSKDSITLEQAEKDNKLVN